jgi:hypothetical protein
VITTPASFTFDTPRRRSILFIGADRKRRGTGNLGIYATRRASSRRSQPPTPSAPTGVDHVATYNETASEQTAKIIRLTRWLVVLFAR